MRPMGDAEAAVFETLKHAVLEPYGEERAAEAMLQMMLKAAAAALWRVSEEPLEPLDYEPLPTHG